MLADFKFHHIGVAVFNIDITAGYYIEAGYKKSDTIIDPIQNVQICFLSKEGMPSIELLAPVDEKSPINDTLKKMGVSPYHCCYLVDNMDEAIKQLKRKKYICIVKPVSACAIDNRRVSFLFNKDIGLIELVEN